LPMQDASLCVPLWLGVTDELAILLTLYNWISPFATNHWLWTLIWLHCPMRMKTCGRLVCLCKTQAFVCRCGSELQTNSLYC